MLRRFLRSTRGTAAAEMALVFPIVGFILLNVVDFSVFAYSKMQVELAAEQAVGFARVKCIEAAKLDAGTCGTNYKNDMLAAAQRTTLGTGVTLAADPQEKFYCADSGGTLVLVATPPTAAPADCSAVVAGSTAKPGSYITAQTQYTYSPIFPGVSVATVLPTLIQSTAWMRLK